MADNGHRESPLDHLAAVQAGRTGGAGVRMSQRAFRGRINLRGDGDSEGFRRAVSEVLGVEPPIEPNTSSSAGDVSVLWLGPDEWLVETTETAEGDTAEALGRSLDGEHAAVTATGEAMTTIALSGPQARDVLAKGMTLDLHPRRFGPGGCARTLLAKTDVLVRQLDETPAFELTVHRSFADYAWRWLADAAREYGLEVTSQ